MSQLRVLHVNSLLRGGGTDDRSVRIASALLQSGHPTWLTGPPDQDCCRFIDELRIPFVPVIPGPLKLPMILRMARFLRQQSIQIIHARHGRDYWPTILAARLSRARPRIVLSRHLASSPSSWFSRRFLLGQCDALLASSRFVSHLLREGDADPESDVPERHFRSPIVGDLSKIRVVYGGIDTEMFRPGEALEQRKQWGLQKEHYALGVVGGYSLPRGKGQPEFLRAAARIARATPQARFLIVGQGNMKEALLGDIQSHGLGGVARLTGYCHDMPAAMNALDCLVHPAVGTESWGSVIVEAHACGKPVIASNLDGIPEAFEAGGYGQLVKPGSIEELSAAMRVWANTQRLDSSERWSLHSKVASRYSLQQAAQHLSEVYHSLIAPGRRARPAASPVSG